VAPGDIVLFRFPVAEGHGSGIIKRRPCLVVNRKTVGGDDLIDIAYGTTAKSRANRGFELHISHDDDLEQAGIAQPTRFVCARRVLVSPLHRSFDPLRDADPHIGRLSPGLMPRHDDLRGKIRQAKIEGWKRQPKLTLLTDHIKR
jgi:mRNA-degrading endonuclease toxin of MazEF toxin-antitoxin module